MTSAWPKVRKANRLPDDFAARRLRALLALQTNRPLARTLERATCDSLRERVLFARVLKALAVENEEAFRAWATVLARAYTSHIRAENASIWNKYFTEGGQRRGGKPAYLYARGLQAF